MITHAHRVMAICPTVLCLSNAHAQPKTVRELGLTIGVMPAGRGNAITDVAGVRVGHMTLVQGDSVRMGVTAIVEGLPVATVMPILDAHKRIIR